MNLEYDDPEEAAVELLEDNSIDEINYGMVRARMRKGGGVVFYDIDSGHSMAVLGNKPEKEMFNRLVTVLVKTDEEIRSRL